MTLGHPPFIFPIVVFIAISGGFLEIAGGFRVTLIVDLISIHFGHLLGLIGLHFIAYWRFGRIVGASLVRHCFSYLYWKPSSDFVSHHFWGFLKIVGESRVAFGIHSFGASAGPRQISFHFIVGDC